MLQDVLTVKHFLVFFFFLIKPRDLPTSISISPEIIPAADD
uniref:Uncharacterized protein n=1 Tax=Rhizophora mucronata TaxID=61149 RepID=A0A2P2P0F0_RHIMU